MGGRGDEVEEAGGDEVVGGRGRRGRGRPATTRLGRGGGGSGRRARGRPERKVRVRRQHLVRGEMAEEEMEV